ncbi:MAG: GMC family oxidoreductase N-terminal domain-containing protein [Pseudomonadota bacterium]
MSRSWDYIIVGGGTAGCVLAARLSEDPSRTVLLLEAGGAGKDLRFAVPGAQLLVRAWDKFAWQYPVRPDASRLGYEDTWRRGKALGGSSMINGLIFARGLPSDYNGWAANGAPGWSYKDVLPAFQRVESFTGDDTQQRGSHGPVGVEVFQSPHPLTQSLKSGFVAQGAHHVDDINALHAAGSDAVVGDTQTNQKNGLRHSAQRTYLAAAKSRKSLTVITQAISHKIVFEQRRAVAVSVRIGENTETFRADREIVLCAGPIASPHVLAHSGIGPGESLRAHEIDVVSDSPEVGRNLQEHPELYLEYGIDQPSYVSAARPWGMLKSGLQFLLNRTGPATSPGTHLLAYMKSAATVPLPDLLFFAGPWGALEDSFQTGRAQEVYSLSPSIARPYSRGQISVSSPDPEAMPKIDANLLGDVRDMQLMKRGVHLAQAIAAHPPFAKHVTRTTQPFDMEDDASLEEYIRTHVSICYHASGTCRMGADDASVVDPQLRVRGVEGLRVADASIMPLIPSGNTMAPVFMIAERAADFMKQSA